MMMEEDTQFYSLLFFFFLLLIQLRSFKQQHPSSLFSADERALPPSGPDKSCRHSLGPAESPLFGQQQQQHLSCTPTTARKQPVERRKSHPFWADSQHLPIQPATAAAEAAAAAVRGSVVESSHHQPSL